MPKVKTLLRMFTATTITAMALAILASSPALFAQDAPPPATIVDDEGGPVVITGVVTYTSPFFTAGVAQPMVILEDQTGFVDRNEHYLMPPESQTIGQITSDFYESPFTYSIALPIEPQGALRDVDNDSEEDTGVMTFAIAYWTNTFGDPFLEERDLSGGGWSTAYASTRVSEEQATEREYIGGKILVYAPDDQQGFPSGFGEDGLLFTEDDPIVILPQGYTIVDMDTDPFTFSRPREAVVDLIEPDGAALADYSELSYTEAFEALVEKLRHEYAFTEYKNVDWDALLEEFRPQFEAADAANDATAYRIALRAFAWSIPDGHVNAGGITDGFQEAISGGIGLGIRDVDSGDVVVNFILPDGPADEAGIEVGAVISEINGTPIDEWVDNAVAYSAPFSTDFTGRLQKLRYAVRAPLGESFEVTYQNPDADAPETVTLETVPEYDSFNQSSFAAGTGILDLPVQFNMIDDTNYAYVKITSFFDNQVLTVQLWERLLQTLNEQGVAGLVIDMRQNSGGFGFLADQMAAYFFQEPLTLGNTARYDESTDSFYADPRYADVFYLPDESLRYDGKVAVLVAPSCVSACEFFAYDMAQQDRAAIVGQYPTGGLGGSVDDVLMPGGIYFRATYGRAVDNEGNIHIEGIGVPPTVQVPVTLETLTSDGDPILDAAVEWLDGATQVEVTEGDPIAIGEEVEGDLPDGGRVSHLLTVSEGDVVTIIAFADDDGLDTFLRLYDTDGNLLLDNDDIEDGNTDAGFVELEIPQDMTLVVEVGAYGDRGGGAYTLSVQAE